MNDISSPCWNCSCRRIGCHNADVCPDLRMFQEEKASRDAVIRRERDAERGMCEHIRDRARKVQVRKNLMKGVSYLDE